MSNILQVSFPLHGQTLWFDFVELDGVNDLKKFVEAAKNDYPESKIRIVQVIEE